MSNVFSGVRRLGLTACLASMVIVLAHAGQGFTITNLTTNKSSNASFPRWWSIPAAI
jgi:hypothetical protein